jgi:hypothetical protein
MLDPALGFGLSLLVVLGLLALLAPRRAVVGTDGVAIEGLFRRSFLPFADLTGLTAEPDGVRLHRAGKHKVFLARAPGGEALGERIQAAMAAHGRGAQAHLDLLDRRGRPLEAWLSDLRGLVDAAAGYRAGALVPDHLAAIAEDAAISPERRVAAAVSAVASGDEAARRRVRIAAEACADEDLRAALEQAAEAEAAGEALARVTQTR